MDRNLDSLVHPVSRPICYGGVVQTPSMVHYSRPMRRSLRFRLFAALFAPWFALAVAEPVPMHDCPEHSLHPAAAHAMAPAPLANAVANRMATMAHAAMEHSGTTHTHGHSGTHQCCCLGACCAAVAAVVSPALRLAALPPAVRRTAPPAPVERAGDSCAEHALPFANGPPVARA